MSDKQEELLRIFSLLDDPDEDISLNAMAELLDREDELGDLPARFQESSDPLLRKRIHQLQAALVLRRRRKYFLSRLYDRRLDFFDLLIDVHLQWFDNDSRPEIEAQVAAFYSRSLNANLSSLEELASFMRKNGMTAERDSTLRPEAYCIGSILYDGSGAESLLAALAAHISVNQACFTVVRTADHFAVCDDQKRFLVPAENWRISPAGSFLVLKEWTLRDVLLFAMSALFCAAVNSDSFRYVLTLAQSLTGDSSDAILDFFPYPYHPDRE